MLFRSRWYALAWALFMAASAIMFTTTGAGAWLTGTGSDAQAGKEARENQFRSWAEDDKRRGDDELGYDPSSPERVRDGLPPPDNQPEADRRAAPFSPSDADSADEAAPEGAPGQ